MGRDREKETEIIMFSLVVYIAVPVGVVLLIASSVIIAICIHGAPSWCPCSRRKGDKDIEKGLGKKKTGAKKPAAKKPAVKKTTAKKAVVAKKTSPAKPAQKPADDKAAKKAKEDKAKKEKEEKARREKEAKE